MANGYNDPRPWALRTTENTDAWTATQKISTGRKATLSNWWDREKTWKS